MAHYRKIDPRMWNDEKFRSLSTHGKLAFCFLLTHPHMTALGAMRATIPGLVAELGGEKGFAEGFREAFAKGLAKHDERASFVYLPRFLRYNPPESPNVVRAWAHSVDLVPECDLKTQLLQEVKGYVEGLSEAFREALPEAFAKGMPNQEQEQEQELEGAGAVAPPPAKRKEAVPLSLHTSLPTNSWAEWLDWRRSKKHPCDDITLRKHLKLLATYDTATQTAIIDQSINANWQGLFPPKGPAVAPRQKPAGVERNYD